MSLELYGWIIKNIIDKITFYKAVNMNFTEPKGSSSLAIAILAGNGIEVDDDETTVIVDFLYIMAKNHEKAE